MSWYLIKRSVETQQEVERFKVTENKVDLLRDLGLERIERNLRNGLRDDKFVSPQGKSEYEYKWSDIDEASLFVEENNSIKSIGFTCDNCKETSNILYGFRDKSLCEKCYNDNDVLLNYIKNGNKKSEFKPIFNDNGIYKSVLYGDFHIPYHNKEAQNILYQIIEELQPNEIVDGGDSIDGSQLSSKFPNYEKEKVDLYTEIKMFENHLNYMKKLSPNSKMTRLECNHFNTRLDKFIANNPAMKNMVKEIDFNFDEISVYGKPYFPLHEYGQNKIAGLHGLYSNDLFAKKLTLDYPHDTYQHHSHTEQCYVNNNGRKGYGIGCMCKLDMAYLFNRPTRWVNQFAIMTYDANNDMYSLEFININDGIAIYRDKIYRG